MLRDASGNIVMTKTIKAIIIVVAILMIATITALSVFLGMYLSKDKDWRSNLENSYEQSYYSLMDSVFNLENNFAKLQVSKGSHLQEEMFMDVALQAQTALGCLNSFSYNGYDISALIKYANQTCDYAKYCVKKLQQNQPLDAKDYEISRNLHDITKKLQIELYKLGDDMKNNNGSFVTNLNEISVNFVSVIEGINNTIEYPSMIYDGPFSESLEVRVPKGLAGGIFTKEQAEAEIKIYLQNYEIKNIKFQSENVLNFETYLFEFETQDGRTGNIQLTKQGAFMVNFTISKKGEGAEYDQEQCIQIASDYCKQIGLDSMQEVWASVVGGEVYINFCYKENDIIFYPDMVKVKVAIADGAIVGFEALNFIYNHTQRELEQPLFQESQISEMDFGDMQTNSIRLCVIPTDDGKEKLTYEVAGELEEEKFFVYVDAMTGKSCKTMRVIDSEEGSLLI